ncbi:MAG: GNAT family N-acetyltransferase [Spirochaetota bacterium]|nr:GNAT family N-acetyltransferase [Spirochaetota bacterium]
MNIYHGEITEEIRELLLEADPSKDSLATYFDSSIKFVLEENASVIGICVLIIMDRMAEIKNISIGKGYQNRGMGSKLLQDVFTYCKDNNILEIFVGTGNSSLGQLAFYQKNGFRITGVHENYFINYPDPIYENGIQCLDLIILKKSL